MACAQLVCYLGIIEYTTYDGTNRDTTGAGIGSQKQPGKKDRGS